MSGKQRAARTVRVALIGAAALAAVAGTAACREGNETAPSQEPIRASYTPSAPAAVLAQQAADKEAENPSGGGREAAALPMLPPIPAADQPQAMPAEGEQPSGDPAGAREPAAADVDLTFNVPLGTSPWKGATEPLAVLIVFADFECPFSARAAKTLDRLVAAHPDELRVVYKFFPIHGHEHALTAAQAAAAAHAQGRFWEMHDLLYADPQHLEREDLERQAEAAGLNMTSFRDALDNARYRDAVASDTTLGHRFGVAGTPTFFLNGRRFSGAPSFARFDAQVAEAVARGRALFDGGLARAEVYATLVRDGLDAAPAPPPPPPETVAAAEPAGAAGKPELRDVRIDAWNPSLGPSAAPVTLVVFTEYLCPFCQRLEGTLQSLRDRYGSRLRIVYRNYIIHSQAEAIARAALAANRQGRFDAFHRLAMEHMADMRSDVNGTIDRVAAAAGLDVGRLHVDMERADLKAELEADVAEGQRVGVDGTPSTFVNGRLISGAHPAEDFRAAIDAALNLAASPTAATM